MLSILDYRPSSRGSRLSLCCILIFLASSAISKVLIKPENKYLIHVMLWEYWPSVFSVCSSIRPNHVARPRAVYLQEWL